MQLSFPFLVGHMDAVAVTIAVAGWTCTLLYSTNILQSYLGYVMPISILFRCVELALRGKEGAVARQRMSRVLSIGTYLLYIHK